jgi:arsenite methyltransferase
MGIRDRLLAGTARQLSRPEGFRGRMLARGLNRGNRAVVAAAVEASGIGPGGRAADIGFGGGVGLALLLERVGTTGRVEGVDLSTTMLRAAEVRFRAECAKGRLLLHHGTIAALPLADGSVDGLITVNTVYFIEDLGVAFGELARVVAPGGRAVVGLGDPDAMSRMPVTAHGFRLRPVEELLEVLRGAGFAEVGHERHGDDSRPFHLLVGQVR